MSEILDPLMSCRFCGASDLREIDRLTVDDEAKKVIQCVYCGACGPTYQDVKRNTGKTFMIRTLWNMNPGRFWEMVYE